MLALDPHVDAVRGAVLPGSDLDGLAVGDARPALDHRDAVLLQQRADAAGKPRDDAVLPAHGLREVDAWRLDPDADVHGSGRAVAARCRLPIVRDLVELLRRMDQGLGRNAADIEASAAEPISLDEGDLHTELRGADGCDIAAGAAADDQQLRS